MSYYMETMNQPLIKHVNMNSDSIHPTFDHVDHQFACRQPPSAAFTMNVIIWIDACRRQYYTTWVFVTCEFNFIFEHNAALAIYLLTMPSGFIICVKETWLWADGVAAALGFSTPRTNKSHHMGIWCDTNVYKINIRVPSLILTRLHHRYFMRWIYSIENTTWIGNPSTVICT